METLAKIVFGLLISAYIFADKVPTAKKQSGIPLIAFVVVVFVFMFVGMRTGGIIIE